MNRWLSFSISLVAHMSCVGLLLFIAEPPGEKPVIVEACRVTLFAPTALQPSSPRSEPAVKSPARPVPKKATPRPRPVFVTRKITRPKRLERAEPSYDIREIKKLERETPTPPPVARMPEGVRMGELSVSTGGSSSFDAYVASIIKSNWVRPSRAVVGEEPPSVSVSIRIAMDGRITRSEVTRSSGIGLLDASAVKAIERSNPLPMGLPSSMGGRYYDVTIIFHITSEA